MGAPSGPEERSREPDLSLPRLQDLLDRLQRGERFSLAASDCRRLFGANDAAPERLAHFAEGHGCTLDASASSITFRKAWQPRR